MRATIPKPKPRPRYLVMLEPVPYAGPGEVVPPICGLRRALKFALRSCNLKAVEVREVPQEAAE